MSKEFTGDVLKAHRGMSHQALSLLTLTAQNTALVLVTKFSYRQGSAPYLTSTVVICSEALKLLVSCIFLRCVEGKGVTSRAFRELVDFPTFCALALPSLLYVVQNNLLFEAIRLLNPTLYMVCCQSKILTSALFSVVLLKTRITLKQRFSLVLLTMGVVLVQLGSQNVATSNEVEELAVRQNLKGVLVVLAASTTSGFAGTYLERMYKVSASRKGSIWFRNLQLACFSVPLAIVSAYIHDYERLTTESSFTGYDVVVFIIILLHALGGIVVATVLRYAGNVLKCFAVSLSICICVAVTSLATRESEELSVLAFAGIVLVIASTFMYSNVL